MLHTSSEYEVAESVSPILKGSVPNIMMKLNSRSEVTTEKKRFLKSKYEDTEEYITSRKPLELAGETPPIVKVQSVANMGSTSTTYTTPPEDIADRLVTKMSENLFTPEISRSGEYSSSEEIANNTDTITVSSEASEDKPSNEVPSLEEKAKISKDKLYQQFTIFKQRLSQDQTPSYDLKPAQGQKLLLDKKNSHGNKVSHDKKPSQDQISSDEQKPSQDQKTLQSKKLLREEKMSVPHLKETLQSNSRLETSQETSQETLSEEKSQPTRSPSLLSLTEMSLSDIPLKKPQSEIALHEKLPKTKHSNEEDSEDKYISDEKSLQDKDDVSRSESESESSAISIEIPPEIETSGEKMLRFQNAPNDAALHEETLVTLISSTTYPTDELFSDSELNDPQLSLAPSLAKKIKKENQTDIDKTILTLLYLSDNDKDNDMNRIMGPTQFYPMKAESHQGYDVDAESELTSEEDVSIKPKTKKNTHTFRSTNVKKDSNKRTANDEFSRNILFDILKEAVDNGMLTNELNKRMNKLKKKP